ncbi:glutamine amidotransferase [Tessaracoccus sp. MC1865]|uniref:glutamine amidotransferase n=1 Tax=Tessaracoccus sp. MC1865 TaxID=2760310 RepID=UPI00160183A5|nr:glutamine amidotransferase [Tessaracoccus sp. MC1865]MBB1484933.1 glutamine amidotransferase [Tessaracoccus sp. MC1865]QTO38634.1 glutamine amidotransferase [Tessaracoccus sp. MC1865]
MKPFLLLSTRPEDDAAEGEREAVVRLSALADADLVQLRVENEPLPQLDLEDYAGIFLGGGPFNASDTEKSPLQRRVEADLNGIIDEVVERDFPFVGLCYGVGTLTDRLGGVVDRTFGEPVGTTIATVTSEGRKDPIFDGVPGQFEAFVGHKEACRRLPPSATLLATGTACPVQAFRVGRNVYATQFHPELDSRGLADRIRIYRDAGYFEPAETETLVRYALATQPTPAVHRMLTNFVAIARMRDLSS